MCYDDMFVFGMHLCVYVHARDAVSVGVRLFVHVFVVGVIVLCLVVCICFVCLMFVCLYMCLCVCMRLCVDVIVLVVSYTRASPCLAARLCLCACNACVEV